MLSMDGEAAGGLLVRQGGRKSQFPNLLALESGLVLWVGTVGWYCGLV